MEHFNDNAALKHFGILGMKWGIRRYQNRDGTLTEEGRKRYLNSDGSYNETAKKELKISRASSGNTKQRVEDLSDDELRTRVTRLDMEKRYKQLMQENDGFVKKTMRSALDHLANKGGEKVIDILLNKVQEAMGASKSDRISINELSEMLNSGDYGELTGSDISKFKTLLDMDKVSKKSYISNMTLSEYDKIIKGDDKGKLNCTPFVRQVWYTTNKWGDILCQRGSQTRGTQRNSSKWS